jgi:hypothetical protein
MLSTRADSAFSLLVHNSFVREIPLNISKPHGEKMIGRAKKTDLIAKLSTLSQTMANLKRKCKTIWFIGKQVWYVPFLWSLAWYSYWIFRSALVLHTPLLQINAIDYFGAIISTIALLVAGYRARAPIKRSVGLATDIGFNVKKAFSSKARPKEGIQIQSLPRKPEQSTQLEIPRPLERKVKQQRPVETRLIPKGIVITKKPVPRSPTVKLPPPSVDRHSRVEASKEMSTECLTCAKLVDCAYRQRRAIELSSQSENQTPCRFAAELWSENTSK